jgi:hypothetical protein
MEKAAALRGADARALADQKAAAGILPQWTTKGTEEAFHRFRSVNPAPKGELEYLRPLRRSRRRRVRLGDPHRRNA